MGGVSGRAPQSTGATIYIAFGRSRSRYDQPAPQLDDNDELVAYIAAREREAQ